MGIFALDHFYIFFLLSLYITWATHLFVASMLTTWASHLLGTSMLIIWSHLLVTAMIN